MSVVTIPNQTVVFNYPLNDCDSCDPRDYCTPVLETETVDFQFKQTPCGPDLNCDSLFNKLSETLVTNGTFNGSAAGWTLGGLDWSYGGGAVSHAATGGNTLSQAITGLNDEKSVYLRFTISAYAGPANGIVVSLGALNIGTYDANGSYTVLLSPTFGGTNTLIFDPDPTAAFTLDNIEIYELVPCWDFDETWLAQEDGGILHSAGLGTAVASILTPPLTNGVYYRVIFTVDSMTDGTVTARLGTNLGTAITEDGTYTQYIIANGTGFDFVPTSDFDGIITYASIKALKNDWTFGVLDLNDATEYTATGVAEYFEDYVTVSIDPQDWLPGTASCFKIVIHDLCSEYGDNLVLDGSFINGFDEWDNAANWFADFHSLYCFVEFNSTLYQHKVDSNGDPVIQTATKYNYKFRVTGTFPANTNLKAYTGAQLMVTVTTAGEYDAIVTVAAPVNYNVWQFGFLGDLLTANQKLYVTNVELYAITEVDDTYTSQCFKLISDAGCTRLIEGYSSGTALGFNFEDTGFIIKQRMGVVSVNPNYPTTGSEYLFSDGERKIITAQSEKYWTFRSEFIPEWGHDALRCQKICDHFFIDSIEYFSKPDEYSPDYLGNNDYVRLSSVSFEIRKKSDTIFNNYCNNS